MLYTQQQSFKVQEETSYKIFKGEINSSIIVVGDVNILILVMDKTSLDAYY